MSKKRMKKSRLTKTDVNTICEMQRTIVAYENYIVATCAMIQHRYDLNFKPILLVSDTPMKEMMAACWKGVGEMKKELLELKGNGSVTLD